jgi:ABC-type transport system involved in cytochrome c biogenesis ATPase subunit/GNAT superfamily N-acetyltransferase
MREAIRRRKEYFRINRFVRTYDRVSGKFVFDVRYKTSVPLTDRTIAVSEAFGLGIDEDKEHVVLDNVQLKIGSKDIVYITGDSGAGKSVLLRALKKDLGDEAVDINDIQVDSSKPLIETVGRTVEEGLELLSKVGLNDAFLFLRTYDELSEGQKYRYRIAKLIESHAQWWILDELCSTLDRDTAKIVAYNLQKLARQQGKAVLAATTHTDLFEDLSPSVHIHKRFGKEISIRYFPNEPVAQCSLVREMRGQEGSLQDWKMLMGFHYRGHRFAAFRKIFGLKRADELCAVIVYCYPPPAAYGRRMVLPKMSMRELNEKLSIISRVVVHPKYRTIGLGAKLVRETLPLAGTPYVEMSAVMAKYNPFAEKGGMQKIVEQPPAKEAIKVAEVLQHLGFNIQLLGSEKYVLNKLQTLSNEDLVKVREAFIKHRHARFMKIFFWHTPFGKKKAYVEEINKASLDRLARLTKVCGFLMQAKVYLFWQNPSL